MSVQFGKCNFDGKPLDPDDLNTARAVLAPYGPDGEGYICKDNFAVLYRAFHTTRESRNEVQPHICTSDAVVTWDGRLDNREELVGLLTRETSLASTDLGIVAAAYQRWGTGSFARLMGDWALSIWEPKTRSLLLAKDFAGSRHLYYSVEEDRITWCTILDPLVLFSGHSLKLEEEYIAGWLSFFPAAHLTPYVGIHAVPPGSFVRLLRGVQTVSKYWDFNPSQRVRYRTDHEYEEHFRVVLSESVRRRLRSDSPVLAELSGGMDSSSIVCVADKILQEDGKETPRLDTVSYYDDSEPNWNERPYFTKVEQNRGREGTHIDVGCPGHDYLEYDQRMLAVLPRIEGLPRKAFKQLASRMACRGNRVLLSGLGGDEFTGGVPTPIPELADLLRDLNIRALAIQLKRWALSKRKPWFHLLLETARRFLPLNSAERPVPWLDPQFVRRNVATLTRSESRLRILGSPPSFQENLKALDALQGQLACTTLQSDLPREVRYPYLDRSFLEFLFAIPRQQLMRPGERRSLMRRALSGILPQEILQRRRKAYIVRSPMIALAANWPSILDIKEHMIAASLTIIDSERFFETLEQVNHGVEIPTTTAARTLSLEFWLRGLVLDRNIEIAGAEPRLGIGHAVVSEKPLDLVGRMNRFQLADCRKMLKGRR